MYNKKTIKFFLLLFSQIVLLGGISFTIIRQPDDKNLEAFRKVSDFVDENEKCFVCHGESEYRITDQSTGQVITKTTDQKLIIKREDYYRSNHKSFACIDCHSDQNIQSSSLVEQQEVAIICIDCHGNDEKFERYQFEKIEEEFLESIHHKRHPTEFTCWKCHNPHTYHISIRNTENLPVTIAYDNAICLSCHAESNRSQVSADRPAINISQQHQWLPNRALHFKKARCIECHTKIDDNILVAHLILPKEEAVHRCSECHSRNSLLLVTLYKFQSKEARNKYGFFNAVVMNDAFLIGANRNYLLNLISLAIFGLTFLGIMLHILFRIIRMNKN